MKLYVTGGTGLVGSNVIRLAKQQGHEVIASQYGPEPEWNVDYELDPLDMGDAEVIRKSILKHKPDVVVHAAAIVDQIFMDTKRELSWQIMVTGTRAFAEACREIDARLVFVSSDWVFDGMQEGILTEDSPPKPVNFYGVMKMASECELGAIDGLNYGIGRLAGVYGFNYAAPSLLRKDNGLGGDFVNYAIHNLVVEKPTQIWMGPKVNEIANPTLASDGADMLLRLAKHQGNGIFHCFGSESINRLDLSYHIADVFGADRNLVVPVATDPIVLDVNRHIGIPFRTMASTEKTSKLLGRTAFGVLEGLENFKQEWDAFYS